MFLSVANLCINYPGALAPAVDNVTLALRAGDIGVLIGPSTAPGAFIARRLLEHIPARVHAWVMELVVAASACALIWRALL